MLLSTAMPIAMAAIVIVIISSGRLINPIKPNTKVAANRLGIMPIMDSITDLNKTINIRKIPAITKPRDNICESNKLCNILLYSMSMPVKKYDSFLKSNFFSMSY